MIQFFRRLAWTLIILALFAPGSARAQEAGGLAEEQVSERLRFIENALVSARPPSRVWYHGWMAAYAAGTVVQWGLALAHWNDVKPVDDGPDAPLVRDRAFAQDMLVGGATTALGVGGLLLDPFLPARRPGRLRSMPESTPEERRAKLAEAEDLLRRCARREKSGRGWMTHALNLGVNAAAGLTTVLAFDRPVSDGLTTFAVGEAVSLLNIFTQPRRALRALREYEKLDSGPRGTPPLDESPGLTWEINWIPGRLSLSMQF